MPRLIFLLFGAVILEAFYTLTLGSWAFEFPFLIALQLCAIVGLVMGPWHGLIWGLAAGFLEEFYFTGAGHSLGLTPLVYLWAGWLTGKIFHGQADLRSPVIGAFVTFTALIFGILSTAGLVLMYGHPAPIVWTNLTLLRIVTIVIQTLAAPGILRFLVRFLRPREGLATLGRPEQWNL
ncbi:MAG: hypothetical protein HY401_00730 [Elusimicrobia bacterium]|nr:hypothetical protein [Elusimicrobiota bacterium]